MLAVLMLNRMTMKRRSLIAKAVGAKMFKAEKKPDTQLVCCRTCLGVDDLLSIFYSPGKKRTEDLKPVTGLQSYGAHCFRVTATLQQLADSSRLDLEFLETEEEEQDEWTFVLAEEEDRKKFETDRCLSNPQGLRGIKKLSQKC